MPTSAIGNPEPRARPIPGRGFTLIELLVGVAIIAALLGAAVLAFPRSDERRAELAADRVASLLQLACERAELGGRDVGIAVGERSLSFGLFRGGAWQAMPDSPAEALRPREIDAAVSLLLQVEGRVVAAAEPGHGKPQLACLASGELTPFELELRGPGAVRWRLSGASGGEITQERLDAPP